MHRRFTISSSPLPAVALLTNAMLLIPSSAACGSWAMTTSVPSFQWRHHHHHSRHYQRCYHPRHPLLSGGTIATKQVTNQLDSSSLSSSSPLLLWDSGTVRPSLFLHPIVLLSQSKRRHQYYHSATTLFLCANNNNSQNNTELSNFLNDERKEIFDDDDDESLLSSKKSVAEEGDDNNSNVSRMSIILFNMLVCSL